MKIIIAGAGAVGTHLARLLVQENHDITLMDTEKERLNTIHENVDLLSMVGNCTSLKDLLDANIRETDLFIGVTPEESRNITSCMLASNLGAKKTLARIDNYEYLMPKNLNFFEKLGVNSMIYPEMMAAKEIVASLKNPWTRIYWELADGAIILTGIKIRESSPICNKFLSELSQDYKRYHIVAIKRKESTFIPKGNDQILPDDIVYFTILRENFSELPRMLGKEPFQTKNVMIMGGSRIAMRTVQYLPETTNIKIIETDMARAELLVETLPSNATVFLGDGRDAELLVSEGINDTDAFIALTGNSEANILACMAARQYGVRKTIAEVENLDYLGMAGRLDIGTVINKKLIAASKIYELLLRADATNIKFLTFADANVGEIVAKPNSKVTKKQIKNLKLPNDITFGALIRNNKSELIEGDTQIEAHDRVVVFFLNKSMKQIESLFS